MADLGFHSHLPLFQELIQPVPNTLHWFSFETEIIYHNSRVPVIVEAIILADQHRITHIEGVKVRLKDSGTLLVLSDEQMQTIYGRIYRHGVT